MACGAVINAVWDLWARIEGKPLWEMVVVSTATIFSASASVAPQRTLASFDPRTHAQDMEAISKIAGCGPPTTTSTVVPQLG